jgi:hypothetical protein
MAKKSVVELCLDLVKHCLQSRKPDRWTIFLILVSMVTLVLLEHHFWIKVLEMLLKVIALTLGTHQIYKHNKKPRVGCMTRGFLFGHSAAFWNSHTPSLKPH